ncbi:MAG: choice-of-anchor D domain-containing protein [Deltaproteobacteria bacterium]|nr:choice-of-anchor D domain-containing protein [Deltaproteobacteria bacterium]
MNAIAATPRPVRAPRATAHLLGRSLGLVVAAALAVMGCGGKTGTYVVVRVEGTVPGTIARIELAFTYQGSTRQHSFAEASGPVTLPSDGAFKMTGVGPIMVTARALDGAGDELGRGSASGTVRADEVETLTITLGEAVDGGLPDGGGSDGGLPDLAVLPASHDYGVAATGAPSPAYELVVSNPGVATAAPPVVVLAGTDRPDFALTANGCTGALLSGASCKVSVAFSPLTQGLKSARLEVQAAGVTATAQLTGVAVPPASLSLSPLLHDAGRAVVGQSGSVVSFMVRNNGAVPTGDLVAALQGDDAAHFTLASQSCGAPLGPGDGCTVSVRFTPTGSPGQRTASLTVTGAPGGTGVAAVTGMAMAPGTLTVKPETSNLGARGVGLASTPLLFTVTNTGAPTSPLVTALTGTNQADFAIRNAGCQGVALGSELSCTLEVVMTPSAGGTRTASLTVASASGGAVAALSGVGLAPAALDLEPASHDFGSLPVGATAAQLFTISNTGGMPSQPVVMALSNGAADLAIGNSTCGVALAAGASCTVNLVFTPRTAGTRSAQLTATAASASATVTVSGVGVPAGALVAIPTTRTFADTLVGQQGESSVITIRNDGQVSSGALAVQLTGTGAADFDLVTTDCGAQTLAAGATCMLTVRFRPQSAGLHATSLQVVASPGGTAIATLSGRGLAPARLELVPPSYDYGSVVTGQQSPDVAFTLANLGDLPTDQVTVQTSGTDAASFVASGCGGQVIAAHASCTIQVRFVAQGTGQRTASLTASATMGGTVTSSLTGRAGAPAVLVVTPLQRNFGSVATGAEATAQVRVRNSGELPTGPLSFSFGGAEPGSYAVVVPSGAGECAVNQVLAGAEACNLKLRFRPTSAGAKDATVTVSATPGGSVPVSLSGTGQ